MFIRKPLFFQNTIIASLEQVFVTYQVPMKASMQWDPLNWLDFGISKSLGQKLVFTFLKWSGTSLQKLARLWTIARRTLVFASGKKVHLMKSAPFISFLLHVVVRILVFYKLDQIHSYINVVGLFVYLTFMRAKSMTAQWVSLWKTATFKVENC